MNANSNYNDPLMKDLQYQELDVWGDTSGKKMTSKAVSDTLCFT